MRSSWLTIETNSSFSRSISRSPRDVRERHDGAGDVTELVAKRRAAGQDRKHAAVGVMNFELLVGDRLAAERRVEIHWSCGIRQPSLATRLNRLQ